MNVLVSCFACGPNWGSEVGMGWNWVINLSQFCQLEVITEKGFQNEIEEVLPTLTIKYPPKFHYIDIGEHARILFRKQGSFKFYQYYKEWQLEAYNISLQIISERNIQIAHQLNMTGYREPGYLWQIEKIPFVWGPVAGFGQIPWSFIWQMSFKNKLFWGAKHIINAYQMRYYSRVKKCTKRADLIVAATKETQIFLKELYQKESTIINDSGTFNEIEPVVRIKNGEKIELIWVGIINARKSLDIAIKALASSKNRENIELHVCGNGPEEKNCKILSQSLGIENLVTFHGKVEHKEVIEKMKRVDAMLFTSLMEGTPNVVNEALSMGLPVICHDNCGQGELIKPECGIKVPYINPDTSITGFANAIDKLNKPNIKQMSQHAYIRAKELTWRCKAEKVFSEYCKLID
ncbi:MAG: glycosyltransferase family 4 protein [Bacteroidales bacterium]|nr:glycosyltransferase family 4 protein [Bacteroidales bacterium]